MTRFDESFAPIAVATRSGFDESLHVGAGAALDASGSIVAAVGDPRLVVYPRSCLKPMQAATMLGLGLQLPDDQLAIACASHDGTPVHLDVVRAILASFGLSESDLQNTPARSLGDPNSDVSSLRQNCSGKHAAMLATCVVNAWPIESYLDLQHPLQVAITAGMADLGCTVHHVGIDGCGAPTHALGLDELARAFGTLASDGGDVGRAMRAHPVLVGGESCDTRWMEAVEGVMAKVGAAGMMALGLADGRALTFKIADGSGVARQVIVPEALRTIGVDVDVLAPATVARSAVAVLGHGREVGQLSALEWSPWSS